MFGVETKEEKQARKDAEEVTRLYWMDKEEKEIIEILESGQEAVLFVETEDFRPNQKITIPLEDDETKEKYELTGRLDELGKTKIQWGLPAPLDEEAYSYFIHDSAEYNTTEKKDVFENPLGYYYQNDGTFLGKTGNSEDVYITDKSTFLMNK